MKPRQYRQESLTPPLEIRYNTNPHKKMRVDAWVKPFFAIPYKANNAQGIIPFGIIFR